jgi:hypothetical protein
VPWYESVGAQRALFAGFLLAFVLGAAAWPITALANRGRQTATSVEPRGRWASMLVSLTGTVNGLFLIALAVLLPRALDLELQYGMPLPLTIVFMLPLVTIPLAVALVVAVLWGVRKRTSFRVGGVVYVAFTAVTIGFVPFLAYWNLLGLRW